MQKTRNFSRRNKHMKKKICKKYLAWMLAATMMLTGIPVQHIQAAKAVKLSSKKITLTVGTSKIITLKNNKKKTRWKIVFVSKTKRRVVS